MNQFTYQSPIGNILIQEEAGCLRKVVFCDDNKLLNQSSELIDKTINQLEEYFQGKRKTFDLPISYRGTDFQKKFGK